MTHIDKNLATMPLLCMSADAEATQLNDPLEEENDTIHAPSPSLQ